MRETEDYRRLVRVARWVTVVFEVVVIGGVAWAFLADVELKTIVVVSSTSLMAGAALWTAAVLTRLRALRIAAGGPSTWYDAKEFNTFQGNVYGRRRSAQP